MQLRTEMYKYRNHRESEKTIRIVSICNLAASPSGEWLDFTHTCPNWTLAGAHGNPPPAFVFEELLHCVFQLTRVCCLIFVELTARWGVFQHPGGAKKTTGALQHNKTWMLRPCKELKQWDITADNTWKQENKLKKIGFTLHSYDRKPEIIFKLPHLLKEQMHFFLPYVLISSKLAHPHPRAYPGHIDPLPWLGRQEFNRPHLLGVGHLTTTPEGWGILFGASILCFVMQLCRKVASVCLQTLKQLPIVGEPLFNVTDISHVSASNIWKKKLGMISAQKISDFLRVVARRL